MTIEQILNKLLSFQTVTSNVKANMACLAWIEKTLRKNPGLVFTRLESEGSASLFVTTKKTKKPTMLLTAHIDVVPGSATALKLKKRGSIISGRGTFDMKFAVACYLKLFEELSSDIKNVNVGLLFTTDEEVGGFNGAKYVLKKGYGAKVVVLPDGGDDWKMVVGEKGVLHLCIKSNGQSAHGSRTWLGENAIDRLIEFLTEVQKLFKKEPCGDANHWHATCNIGKISGGQATNQIADFATASIDIRYRTQAERSRIEGQLARIQKKFANIMTENEVSGDSTTADLSNPYLKKFKRIAKDLHGIEMGKMITHGSSDARFFAAKGIPVIMTRPKGDGHHSENEWIDLKDLERFYQVLKKFVEEVA